MNGNKRARMLTQCEILHAVDDGDGILVTWKDNAIKKTQSEKFDVVFLGTGYKNQTPMLLNDISSVLDIGKIKVNRNYRAIIPCSEGVSLHFQGVNEDSHGISDSLLSVLAYRSKEIIDDMNS